MLHSMNVLKGLDILATDGEIGNTEEFYFDDERWAVRYIVVNTGSWLSGRQVLISPFSVTQVDLWLSLLLGQSVFMGSRGTPCSGVTAISYSGAHCHGAPHCEGRHCKWPPGHRRDRQ
jgi:hypothetical protein